MEGEFLDAYRAGYHLYELNSQVNAATYKINARRHELDEIKDLIRQKEALLIAEETTTEDRILILSDLKELSERSGQIETEILVLVDDRARHEQQLAEYQASVAHFGY